MTFPLTLKTAHGDFPGTLSADMSYPNGTRAWQLTDDFGSPIARLTVAMPNDKPSEGCVFIKDWSENNGVWASLADAGYIERVPVRIIPYGNVDVLEARVLKPELL